jgi:hypothetical protein
MTSPTAPTLGDARPEFDTERLALDVATATERVHETLAGLTATETPEGIRFRTRDGTLLAVLHGSADGVDLHYRAEPAALPATRKARKLRTALADEGA